MMDLSPLYVITGACPVMMLETTQPLIEAWRTHTQNAFEKIQFWIESTEDWEQLSQQTHYGSLFSSHQLIDVRFHKKTLDAVGKAFLTTYAAAPKSNALLLLQAPHLATTSLNFLSKKAKIITLTPLKGPAFLRFIENQLTKRAIQFNTDVPKTLAHLTEGNTLAAQNCIELLDLLKKEPFTQASVQAILNDTAQFPLYALSEACLEGNLERCLRLLTHLKHQDAEPLLILWWLTKPVRQLIQLQTYLQQGQSVQTAINTLNIWSSQQALYTKAMKRVSLSTALTLLETCRTLDIALKSNEICPTWDTFERIALGFCHHA